MAEIVINGTVLFYEELGEGAPICCLHGVGGSSLAWRAARSEFARYGRVITYDRRGSGRSGPAAPRGKITMVDHAQDLLGLLRTLTRGPAVAIGRSYGGGVAVQLALAHPERVRALVLLEPAVTGLCADYDRWEGEFDAAIDAAAGREAPTPPRRCSLSEFSARATRRSCRPRSRRLSAATLGQSWPIAPRRPSPWSRARCTRSPLRCWLSPPRPDRQPCRRSPVRSRRRWRMGVYSGVGYGECGQAVAAIFSSIGWVLMSVGIRANDSANVVVRFRVPTGSASAVWVVGSFKDWTPGVHELAAADDGFRCVSVTVPAGRDMHFGLWTATVTPVHDPDADENRPLRCRPEPRRRSIRVARRRVPLHRTSRPVA